MADDEEPPALSSSRHGPPTAAFSSGDPPPASAFSASRTGPSSSAGPVATDLNSRWKQYESERDSASSDRKTTTAMIGPDGPAHSDYDLYETPEKQAKESLSSRNVPRQLYSGTSRDSDSNPNPSGDLEPRRSYSFTKSGSYDTNALIAKYSGVSGVAKTNSVSSSNIERSHSYSNKSSSSAIPSSARAEAVKVLTMADEHISANQPFEVRRTESGGFRASANIDPESSYSFQRASSNTRRTPSALSGLGFGSSKTNTSTERIDWKANRYAFTDPKFREDDKIADEEDDIVFSGKNPKKNYSDDPSSGGVFDDVDFHGDFPRKPATSSWSARYSDNPGVTTASILDRYDRAHMEAQQKPGRQSARKMFMSTASNFSNNVRAFVEEKVGSREGPETTSRVFGKGFSFKNKKEAASPIRKGGASATGSTNLRTVWKDDAFNDEGGVDEQKKHKTWEQVSMQKKRRRKIAISVLCFIVLGTVIGVSLSKTAWRWKFKNLWSNGNSQLEVTFYATSNTPFGYGTTEEQLKQDLLNIPSDAELITHLGNLQDSSVGMCPAARMGEVASLLHGQAPVPIFVVPGEHDWIRCPNQMSAFARWLTAFGTTEAMEQANSLVPGGSAAAASAGDFERPKSTPEIFSKLHHGVLFFGLHLVSGIVTEGKGMEMQTLRDDKMAIYVRGTLDRLQGEYRAIVLLGNARPGPQQRYFFNSIKQDLSNAKVPTAYVHAHSGSGETEHYPFGKKKSGDVLEGMMAIQAASGASNQPPLKITVGFGKNPFTIG
eukprot:CAMPEP_0197180034 /NCGR_PEP_ID=MMETSP1423-20130617/4793_1 /TAXON_ID=476441 /ORGANISM="Pseudo-nitzschia heimii, Strain UNC1101" /LENGTH=775 /DNA_ID=CAMNT_0042630053 /DNA_START=110 /DNA_END=2437 /DNA_ORIENTATION=+